VIMITFNTDLKRLLHQILTTLDRPRAIRSVANVRAKLFSHVHHTTAPTAPIIPTFTVPILQCEFNTSRQKNVFDNVTKTIKNLTLAENSYKTKS
jgi:hypothetical protein